MIVGCPLFPQLQEIIPPLLFTLQEMCENAYEASASRVLFYVNAKRPENASLFSGYKRTSEVPPVLKPNAAENKATATKKRSIFVGNGVFKLSASTDRLRGRAAPLCVHAMCFLCLRHKIRIVRSLEASVIVK